LTDFRQMTPRTEDVEAVNPSEHEPVGSAEDVLPYGRPTLDDDDRRAVMDVLRGRWLTQGPVVDRFERALCDYFGARYAVTASNGTTALHLAALCLGWQPGDVVIVPAITFLASANCAAYVGAEPFFVDIDDRTLTIDPNEVERHVRLLRGRGRRVRAVVGVDMAGHPCDWLALRELADRYELQLLDDACHAIGGTYANGVKVGSCRHCDLAILSFHPVKHITTGEGGALLTNNPETAARAARLRSHGTMREADEMREWEGPWHYDMVELGYNYRLTDIQCSLGLSQLRKLDRFVAARRELACLYTRALGAEPRIRTPYEAAGIQHAFHLYIARLPFDDGCESRREFFARCRGRGVVPQVHYRPIPLNSFYRSKQRDDDQVLARIPTSLKYYREAVSLPIYPGLDEHDLARVVSVVRDAITQRVSA
jgi:perosamine synthetase